MSINQRKLALTEERDAYFARLAELRVRRAHTGYSTDPVVVTEIDDIELKVTQLDASIKALEVVAEQAPENHFTADRRIDDQRLHIMVATIQATVAEFSGLKTFVHSETHRIYKVLAFYGIVALVQFIGLVILIIVLSWK
jgi:hypothetical protein